MFLKSLCKEHSRLYESIFLAYTRVQRRQTTCGRAKSGTGSDAASSGHARTPDPAPRSFSRRVAQSGGPGHRKPAPAPPTRGPHPTRPETAAAPRPRHAAVGPRPVARHGLAPPPRARAARDRHPLASPWLEAVLALEVALSARPPAPECRGAGADRHSGARASPLGHRADPRRIAQAGHRGEQPLDPPSSPARTGSAHRARPGERSWPIIGPTSGRRTSSQSRRSPSRRATFCWSSPTAGGSWSTSTSPPVRRPRGSGGS